MGISSSNICAWYQKLVNISNNLVASKRHQSCGFSAFNSHAKECFPKNISLKWFTTENHSKEQFEMSGVSDKLPILATEEPPPYSSNSGELGKGAEKVGSLSNLFDIDLKYSFGVRILLIRPRWKYLPDDGIFSASSLSWHVTRYRYVWCVTSRAQRVGFLNIGRVRVMYWKKKSCSRCIPVGSECRPLSAPCLFRTSQSSWLD